MGCFWIGSSSLAQYDCGRQYHDQDDGEQYDVLFRVVPYSGERRRHGAPDEHNVGYGGG